MAKFNYDKSIKELEEIIATLENGSTSVDEFSEMVAKASKLIRDCKTKLRETENDIDNALDGIGQE